MQLKQNIQRLKPSATLAINEHSNELIRLGKKVYKLGFGQSPFPVPEEVVQTLIKHANEKDYLPVRGLQALREAVATYQQKRFGINCSGEDVLIGPGSKELLYIAQLCYDGDLLIPSPSWVSYAPQARIANKESLWIDTSLNPKKMLDAESLENICSKHKGRKFMLILNYPSNPTGTSYLAVELEQIAQVARKHEVLIISDEIYGELMHNGGHVSIANYFPEGTIVSTGLSKWCGAGGWRLGAFTFPKEMRWLIDAMAAVASETFTATSAPIQFAAVSAFRFSPTIESYVQKSRIILKLIGNYAYEELTSVGISMPTPEGGFYLFPNFEKFRVKLAAKGINTSATLCKTILDETGVALLPGEDFGQSPTELSARLSYVDFDGRKALAFDMKKLDRSHINELCPNVVEACVKLKNWLS